MNTDNSHSDDSNNINREPNIISDRLRPADTQLHVLEECVAYQDLREQYDTREDSQLIEFFKKVVERRIKNGED